MVTKVRRYPRGRITCVMLYHLRYTALFPMRSRMCRITSSMPKSSRSSVETTLNPTTRPPSDQPRSAGECVCAANLKRNGDVGTHGHLAPDAGVHARI